MLGLFWVFAVFVPGGLALVVQLDHLVGDLHVFHIFKPIEVHADVVTKQEVIEVDVEFAVAVVLALALVNGGLGTGGAVAFRLRFRVVLV